MAVRQLDLTDQAVVASVVLASGAVRFHAGVAIKPASATPSVLHLAGHYKVRNTTSGKWAEAVPEMDSVDQAIVAAFCLAFMKIGARIAYGLRDQGYLREDGVGGYVYVEGGNGSGQTCSTFVKNLFEWAGAPLVDESTWQQRDADLPDQLKLLEYLAGEDADPSHIAAVAGDLPCMRIRPEEVASASTFTDLPVSFIAAESAGARLASEVVQRGLI